VFLDQTHDPRLPGDGPQAQEAFMQRSDFDFDVISGPAGPPPRPAAESGPAMPRPQPASLDPATVQGETRKP
jgi:hypothetical protein